MVKAKPKILVVDDEKNVLLLMQGFFAGRGHEMLTANNAQSAFAVLEKKDPAIVLLDMRMPGIDGLGVLSHIRQRYPHIKVIVITTYDKQYKAKAAEIGFDAFLPKPLSMQALTDAIDTILSGKASPPKEELLALMDDKKVLAQAKLLFYEPNYLGYGTKRDFFVHSSKSGGRYVCEPAYNKDELLEKLSSLKPDIILGDMMMFNQYKGILSEIRNSPYSPKDIIVHGGLAEKHKDAAQDAGKHAEGPYDALSVLFNRKQLHKLARLVRQSAIEHGLYTRMKTDSWEPPKEPSLPQKPPVEELEQKAIETIANQLSIKEKEITLNSHLMNDLGADSMELIEITMALEDVFLIEIDDQRAKKLLRVKDIIKYIKQNAYK